MGNFVSNWQNLNESRSYPIHENCPRAFPDDIISDMQVFVPAPRGTSNIYTSVYETISTAASASVPYISRLAITKYMLTLVVECRDCTLFCTKSLDDIVPYEPVEFVSSSGICSGWVAFGSFGKDEPFDFHGGPDEVYLDPRAVILYPIATIGGFGVDPVDEPVSGAVKILGSNGLTSRVDKETNTIYLSLESNPGNMYSDPCYVEQAVKSTPDVCSINGAESADGHIIIAFTGEKLKPTDTAIINSLYQTASGSTEAQEQMAITAYRFPLIGTTGGNGNRVFMDLVGVELEAQSSVSILGYRLVYVPADPNKFKLPQRQLEMHACSGYHRPEYDTWTREKFLPPIAELYRAIQITQNQSPESEDDNEAEASATQSANPYFDANLHLQFETYGGCIATEQFETDGTICVARTTKNSAWTDSVVPVYDPYQQKGLNLVLGEYGGKFRFSHRVWNFGAAGLADSAYVEVVYTTGSDTSIRTIRRDVQFKVIRMDPDDSNDDDANLPVDYMSGKAYIESGEVHGYERKYIKANRYSEDEVITPLET